MIFSIYMAQSLLARQIEGRASVLTPARYCRASHSKAVAKARSSPRSSPQHAAAGRSRRVETHHALLPDAAALRSFLVCATAGPSAYADSFSLQQLLSEKLTLPSSAFDQLWPAAAEPWADFTAHNPSAAVSELSAGLDALLTVLSRQEATKLLLAEPALVAAPLQSWMAFFTAMQFSRVEQKNMLTTCPELMAKGDIVTAGAAIRHLCDLGFDEESVRHQVVAWCPQVLTMQQEEITNLIRLWSKFQVGVDERAGM